MSPTKRMPGKTRPCPNCKNSFKYTWLSGMNQQIGVYSKNQSCLLLSKKLNSAIQELLQIQAVDDLDIGIKIEQLLSFYNPIYNFSLWNNIKCPFCNYEFPYVGGIQQRLTDFKVIIIDGMKIITDLDNESYEVLIST